MMGGFVLAVGLKYTEEKPSLNTTFVCLLLKNLVKFVLGQVTMVFSLLVTMAAQERHDVTEHVQCV